MVLRDSHSLRNFNNCQSPTRLFLPSIRGISILRQQMCQLNVSRGRETISKASQKSYYVCHCTGYSSDRLMLSAATRNYAHPSCPPCLFAVLFCYILFQVLDRLPSLHFGKTLTIYRISNSMLHCAKCGITFNRASSY